MSEDRAERAKLEATEIPIAIVQYGIFAYANHAFLELVGLGDRAELLEIPLLDMVSRTDRDALKAHLSQANKTRAKDEQSATANITLVTQRNEYLDVVFSSHKTVFDDEECVHISVKKPVKKTLFSGIKALPWTLYLSVAFLLLFSTLPGLLLQRLDINNAPKVYFPSDEPAVVIDNALRESFPNDQVVVMMFEGVALYSDGFLEAFDDLATTLSDHPLIDDVLSVTTQDHISGSEDGFAVEPLLGYDRLDQLHPSERADFALSDRFARQSLIAADGSALAMVVVPAAADNSLTRLELITDIEKAVEEARLDGYLTGMGGEVPADVAQLRAMLSNNMVFIPLTTIIGLSLIWWMFRRPLAVVAAGISMGVVVSSTIALYVIFGRPFTMISSIIPPLISALTIATLVHLFNALHYAAQRGLVGKRRVEFALHEIRSPARFTTFTTAAGLASLATSPIVPIAVFGLIAAAGVVLIYLVVISAVPQIFAKWDHQPWPSRQGGLKWMSTWVKALARTGIRRPVWVILITVLLLGAGAPQLLNIRVETSVQEYFSTEHEFRRATDRIGEKLVGTTPLEVVIEASEPDALLDPAVLNQIKSFQEWAHAQPQIDKTMSAVDFIEEMHWGFNEEDPAFRTIPDDQELITQYLFIYDGDAFTDFMDEDHRITRISLNVNVHKANEITAVMNSIREYLGANLDSELSFEIAGIGRLFADMEGLLVEGQVLSLSGALLLIFLLMLVLWRSLGQGLLTMVPNLAPILMIFIFMGLFGIWLDMATAMIASVAVGIAVDDTIHVFHGFKERIKKGHSAVLALMRTYSQSGKAVTTTTIILVVQFLSLTTSEFTPFSKFGTLTAIGLTAAWLFDLLVLPAILILIYGRRKKA